MEIKEKCVNVNLGDTQGNCCKNIAQRAVSGWREQGIDKAQIKHVLNHEFPGISPTFATQEEIDTIKVEAAKKLGIDVSKIQVDGIRKDGLVNLLVDW
jgi:hypothetical protein